MTATRDIPATLPERDRPEVFAEVAIRTRTTPDERVHGVAVEAVDYDGIGFVGVSYDEEYPGRVVSSADVATADKASDVDPGHQPSQISARPVDARLHVAVFHQVDVLRSRAWHGVLLCRISAAVFRKFKPSYRIDRVMHVVEAVAVECVKVKHGSILP